MPSRISHPGRPEELPPPDAFWVHGGVAAALAPAIGGQKGRYTLDRLGVHWDSTGGSWWRLSRVQGGRAVLTGFDPMGETHASWTELGGEPPLDLLAGAPSWLAAPWLAGLLDGQRAETGSYYEIGFLYWWDGAWGRAEYPEHVEDDGLCLVDGIGRPVELFSDVVGLIGVDADDLAEEPGDLVRLVAEDTPVFPDDYQVFPYNIPAVARRVDHAAQGVAKLLRVVTDLQAAGHAGQVDEANLRRVAEALGAAPGDLGAALDLARRAGLTPNSTPPEHLPARNRSGKDPGQPLPR